MSPSSADALPAGCAFHPRCPHAIDRCRAEVAARSPGEDAPQRLLRLRGALMFWLSHHPPEELRSLLPLRLHSPLRALPGHLPGDVRRHRPAARPSLPARAPTRRSARRRPGAAGDPRLGVRPLSAAPLQQRLAHGHRAYCWDWVWAGACSSIFSGPCPSCSIVQVFVVTGIALPVILAAYRRKRRG